MLPTFQMLKLMGILVQSGKSGASAAKLQESLEVKTPVRVYQLVRPFQDAGMVRVVEGKTRKRACGNGRRPSNYAITAKGRRYAKVYPCVALAKSPPLVSPIEFQ